MSLNESIKNLWVSSWKEYELEERDADKFMELGKLNIFIGKNNSGKSRLIRKIFNSTPSDFHYATQSELDPELNIRAFINKLQDFFINATQIGEIKRFDVIDFIENGRHVLNDNRRKFIENMKVEILRLANPHVQIGYHGDVNSQLFKKFISDAIARSPNILLPENQQFPIIKVNTIYVPILRGMRPLNDDIHSTLYIKRTQKDYFDSQNESEAERIISGEKLFNLLLENLLGEPEQRERIAKYENLISNIFFEGTRVSLIPKHGKEVVHVHIGNESQRPIYELGDGLQQIFMITSAAFLTEESSLFLIEEPESSLHPGMLRQLVTFLLDETPHQYFITTHSNHILDLTDERNDCKIFKLRKSQPDHGAKFKILPIYKDRNLLIELGIKSSSLYLANCTIWVEGASERSYIREFLKKYISDLEKITENGSPLKKYIENLHYSFVEYQGSCLTHWIFDDENPDNLQSMQALQTTTNIFLIADGDIANKGERVKNLTEQLKDNFYMLEGKEIENLIPEKIAQKTVRILYNEFRREKYTSDIEDIKKLKYDDYCRSKEGLGYHIDGSLSIPNGNFLFANSTSTVKDKGKFCAIATDLMRQNEWSLTPEIKGLCEKILNHIAKFNRD